MSIVKYLEVSAQYSIGRLIEVHLKVNMGRNVWDCGRCRLNTGFTVLLLLLLFIIIFLFFILIFLTENRSKRDIVTTLVQRGYPSDPLKAWKDAQKSNAPEEGDLDDASSVASSTSSTSGPDFGYLLSMSMLSLSREKKEELLKERDNKVSGRTHVHVLYGLA